MKNHNELIQKAKPVSDCHISQGLKNYSKWQRELQKWKPTINERHNRKYEDQMLERQMRNVAAGKVLTTDCYQNKFCEEQRQYLREHPRYLPGRNDRMKANNQKRSHHKLVKAAAAQVDTHLGLEHKRFKDLKKKNGGGVLPPLQYALPKRQAVSQTDGGTDRRRRRRSASTRAPSVAASTVPPMYCEQDFLEQTLQQYEQSNANRAVDPALVRGIYNIGKSAASNNNVAMMLLKHTESRFPDIQVVDFSKSQRSAAISAEPTSKYFQPAPRFTAAAR